MRELLSFVIKDLSRTHYSEKALDAVLDITQVDHLIAASRFIRGEIEGNKNFPYRSSDAVDKLRIEIMEMISKEKPEEQLKDEATVTSLPDFKNRSIHP
jgi:hypothetical protein